MPNRFSLSMTTLFLIGFLLSTHSTFAQQQIKEVIVPARAPWVHSGIYVHAGDEISLQAIGYWAWGEAPQTIVTPDGFAESEQLANGCQYFSLQKLYLYIIGLGLFLAHCKSDVAPTSSLKVKSQYEVDIPSPMLVRIRFHEDPNVAVNSDSSDDVDLEAACALDPDRCDTCTGTLVKTKEDVTLIITAAHCIYDLDQETNEVVRRGNVEMTNLAWEFRNGKKDQKVRRKIKLDDFSNLCVNQNYIDYKFGKKIAQGTRRSAPNKLKAVPYDFAVAVLRSSEVIYGPGPDEEDQVGRRHDPSYSSLTPYTIYSSKTAYNFFGATLGNRRFQEEDIAAGMAVGWGDTDPDLQDAGLELRYAAATVSKQESNTGLFTGDGKFLSGDSGAPFLAKRNTSPFKDNQLGGERRDFTEYHPTASDSVAALGMAVTLTNKDQDDATTQYTFTYNYLIDLDSVSSRCLVKYAVEGSEAVKNDTDCNPDGKDIAANDTEASCRYTVNFGYEDGPYSNFGEAQDITTKGRVEIEQCTPQFPQLGTFSTPKLDADAGERKCNISALRINDKPWLVTTYHCLEKGIDRDLGTALNHLCSHLVWGTGADRFSCAGSEGNYEAYGEITAKSDIVFIKASDSGNFAKVNLENSIDPSASDAKNIRFESVRMGEPSCGVDPVEINNSKTCSGGSGPKSINSGNGFFSYNEDCSHQLGANIVYEHPFKTQVNDSGGVLFLSKDGSEPEAICIATGDKGEELPTENNICAKLVNDPENDLPRIGSGGLTDPGTSGGGGTNPEDYCPPVAAPNCLDIGWADEPTQVPNTCVSSSTNGLIVEDIVAKLAAQGTTKDPATVAEDYGKCILQCRNPGIEGGAYEICPNGCVEGAEGEDDHCATN